MAFDLDFNLSFRDLSMAEVLIDHIARETENVIDENLSLLGKMDINIDVIKQASMMIVKATNDYAESFTEEMKRINAGIDEKKSEILKTEQDFSNYDEALSEARKVANIDAKAITKASKRAPLRL